MSEDTSDRLADLITRLRGLPPEKLNCVAKLVQELESEAKFRRPLSGTGTTHGASPSARTEGGYAKGWPHAPVHRISEHGTYIVTAGTLHKEHLFRGKHRLDLLQRKLLELARGFHWHLEAWAVFSNHYHFVAYCEADSAALNVFLSALHTSTAAIVNQWDGMTGRRVWHNYWETKLTFERSYLARLNYVHQNPVHHGLVPVANQYPWCSAAWFEHTATPAQVKTIYSFKLDRVKVIDDFDVTME